jgi:hypothetical protein
MLALKKGWRRLQGLQLAIRQFEALREGGVEVRPELFYHLGELLSA